MSTKPPAKPKVDKPHSLSDSDIVSKPSIGRTSAAHGTDADSGAGKAAARSNDRDTASDGDKPASPASRQRHVAKGNDRD